MSLNSETSNTGNSIRGYQQIKNFIGGKLKAPVNVIFVNKRIALCTYYLSV